MKESIIFIVVAAVMIAILAYGMDRYEEYECLTWRDQAEDHADYFLTGWQADQCRAREVDMGDIPIRY